MKFENERAERDSKCVKKIDDKDTLHCGTVCLGWLWNAVAWSPSHLPIDHLGFYTDFHMFSMWSTLIMNIHELLYFKHLRTRALLLMLLILTSTAELVQLMSKHFRPFEDSWLSRVTESEDRNSMRPWKTAHVRSFTQLEVISQTVNCLKKFKQSNKVKTVSCPFSWGSVFSVKSIQNKGTNMSNGVGA